MESRHFHSVYTYSKRNIITIWGTITIIDNWYRQYVGLAAKSPNKHHLIIRKDRQKVCYEKFYLILCLVIDSRFFCFL